MSSIDMDHLRSWVGTTYTDEDLISARHARLMAATVDYPNSEKIRNGEYLPPLWHWTFFLEGQPTSVLGSDGHPARGGFMPPVPLPNRMWAGGRVSFEAPLQIGATIRRESSILKVDHKRGTSGELVFVTVLHVLTSLNGEILIREEQDIVYKDASRSGSPPTVTTECISSQFSKTYAPTSTTLFRYSALTFNGHRIHYDADYCREVERYPNLVIHGPLNATMMAGYAEKVSGKQLCSFSYRGLSPALLGDTITLHADVSEKSVSLYAVLGSGRKCMQANAVIDSSR